MSATTELRKLPLWKDWMEKVGQSMTFGNFVSNEDLATALDQPVGSFDFKLDVSKIRKRFRIKGMNFTSRGQYGRGFIIVPPGMNAKEMSRMASAAKSAMRECVILGSNTPLDLLNQEERRIHESLTEKMAMRLALISRKIEPKQLTQ